MQRHCVEGDLGSALQEVGWVRDRIPVVFSHFSCITGLSVQTWAKPWERASTCSYGLGGAPFYTKPHAGLSALPYCTSESTEWHCPVRLENAMKCFLVKVFILQALASRFCVSEIFPGHILSGLGYCLACRLLCWRCRSWGSPPSGPYCGLKHPSFRRGVLCERLWLPSASQWNLMLCWRRVPTCCTISLPSRKLFLLMNSQLFSPWFPLNTCGKSDRFLTFWQLYLTSVLP